MSQEKFNISLEAAIGSTPEELEDAFAYAETEEGKLQAYIVLNNKQVVAQLKSLYATVERMEKDLDTTYNRNTIAEDRTMALSSVMDEMKRCLQNMDHLHEEVQNIQAVQEGSIVDRKPTPTEQATTEAIDRAVAHRLTLWFSDVSRLTDRLISAVGAGGQAGGLRTHDAITVEHMRAILHLICYRDDTGAAPEDPIGQMKDALERQLYSKLLAHTEGAVATIIKER